jgi:hypothetical protein
MTLHFDFSTPDASDLKLYFLGQVLTLFVFC